MQPRTQLLECLIPHIIQGESDVLLRSEFLVNGACIWWIVDHILCTESNMWNGWIFVSLVSQQGEVYETEPAAKEQ